jgi:hypothetical protein
MYCKILDEPRAGETGAGEKKKFWGGFKLGHPDHFIGPSG